MFIILIFGLIVGNATQMQFKYDHCKSINFEGDYCKLQKKLNKYEKDK